MDLRELVGLSRFYGESTDYAIAGGGNTSFKDAERIAIKASGIALRNIDEASFVELARLSVRSILAKTYPDDPMRREALVRDDLMASRIDPRKGARPSVESSLHEMIGWPYVAHTHPYVVNALLCARNARTESSRLFGEEALFVPYTYPGYTLARRLEALLQEYRNAHGSDPKIVLMQNHGLVVGADSVSEVKALTDAVVSKVRGCFRGPLGGASGALEITGAPVGRGAAEVVPGIRMILSGEGSRGVRDGSSLVASARNDSLISSFLRPDAWAMVGLPFTPDNIVYCKAAPLYARFSGHPEEFFKDFSSTLGTYVKQWGFLPKILLVEGLGMIAVEESKRSAETCLDIFYDLMKVSALSENFGGPQFLSQPAIAFIDTWEVENYRRTVAKATSVRRLEGRVAVVTGAAQGFGKGIAEGLFREGANVLIADLNQEAGARAASELNAQDTPNRAVFARADVTDSGSVKDLASSCVKAFGGIDILVSNAGVVRPGGLEETAEADFDLVMNVNYRGYFLCVKHLSPIMKLQRRFQPGWSMDIIQINSKSGLEGSNRNFAYAGSKFGGIGLTQSFALELVEHGIKVNSICPGNFFEGPLWSDPNTGIFLQYLKAGKVPGARTVEDVKRFYESKVPMGRGCRIEDVFRAVLYLLEQEYETGQALPVTGGQVMLK